MACNARKETTIGLSKECQEYHLTPHGWVEGSFKGDGLGGTTEVPTPNDRVLTILCYDVLPSAFSEARFYDSVAWESDDKDEIKRLKKKYGNKPDWFGYERMKR